MEQKCRHPTAAPRRRVPRFSYAGIFRQATSYTGRNRDMAWFAVIGHEWPALKAAYETWLDPGNFDARGQQQQNLGTLTADALCSGASG